MTDGELLYFTPAEFIVMMELAGTGPYSIPRRGEPDLSGGALAQAFSSLFQRGLIERRGDRFAPSDSGGMFRRIRRAASVVMISAGGLNPCSLACYGAGEELWLVECVDDVLSTRYRVQRRAREDMAGWLLDREVLPVPRLGEEDTGELLRLLRGELARPAGAVLLRFDVYRNGGDAAFSYELLAGSGITLIVRRERDGRTAEIYTREALSRLLAECFGEERHGHR